MSHRHPVVLIPGDGIGPEIAEATLEVVAAAGVSIDWNTRLAGVAALEAYGTPIPPETLDAIRQTKVALKGPLTTPVGGGFRSVNVAIRQEPHHAAFSVRGDAFLEQGDYDHAIEDYGAARRLDQNVARAYLLRSEQRKAKGEIEQASADLEQAKSLEARLSAAPGSGAADAPPARAREFPPADAPAQP